MNPFDVSLLGALGAGALSFLSPCVLPLIPAYLVFLGGEAATARRVMPSAIAFVLGFASVFIAMGATATALSRLVADNLGWMSVVAGIVVIAFGLHVMGVTPIRWLYAEKRLHPERRPAGPPGAYVLGLAFAFGWTPCVGPILATILMIAAGRDSVGQGIGLLATYAAGLGVPFLLAAALTERFTTLASRFRRHLRKVELATGSLMVATGALILVGRMGVVGQWLLDVFPAFQGLG
ncbi:MAG: cytochrome c biogenesis protein CcdA [Magnetospirillum sp.]|nr:MAG: cytochrome c biogenesis protein CcdA [Magnetospirillum sp.]